MVDVLERLPEHRARHEEIKRNWKKSTARAALNHEEIALVPDSNGAPRTDARCGKPEIVLRTTLGSQITQWEELLKSATKAELAREKGQLEAEIGRLTASLDSCRRRWVG